MNAIEVTNLSYRYPDGAEALRGVSFAVAPGESVGLIGPNGAGKSTLLLHLNGLLPEDPPLRRHLAGGNVTAVSVFGQPIVAEDLPEIRRRVGLLFQDPDDQIFCATVCEDVGFGPEQLGLSDAEAQARVAEALAVVGLTGFEDRAPHHLSGGEKRRVCLAGILACRSDILALDEPTSGLDPRGKRELKSLLRDLPVTKLIATHDLELVVELCPRTLVMDGGRIVADGPTAKLLADEGLMLAHGLETPHILRHLHPH